MWVCDGRSLKEKTSFCIIFKQTLAAKKVANPLASEKTALFILFSQDFWLKYSCMAGNPHSLPPSRCSQVFHFNLINSHLKGNFQGALCRGIKYGWLTRESGTCPRIRLFWFMFAARPWTISIRDQGHVRAPPWSRGFPNIYSIVESLVVANIQSILHHIFLLTPALIFMVTMDAAASHLSFSWT